LKPTAKENLMKIVWMIQSISASLRDMVGALAQRRQRWLLILLPVLLVISLLLAIVSSSGALAPFLYPLF
jgi:hypothetical protein